MDYVEIPCPWCGELNDIGIEADLLGTMTQDCQVCCQPMELDVRRDEWGDPDISVQRG